MNRPDMTLIYTQYRKKVMGYIRTRVTSFADAEDLCQDVFEKVQIKLESYDPAKSALSTWIYTITRNTVIDYYRRRRPGEELDETIPADGEVDEALLNEQALGDLAVALKALPEELRRIVVYRYYDGLPLTDIARQMGISYGAVKLRHNSALKLLRDALGD